MTNILESVSLAGRVLAVLENVETGEVKVVEGKNIVTNDGDVYYAESVAAIGPSDDFDAASSGLRLGSDNTAPTKTDTDLNTLLAGTQQALDASYETVDDGDADNTGAGVDVVTWRYSYDTTEGNVTNIVEGAIVDDRTTPTAALTHFTFAAAFDKTSSDTLKIFVNHTFNGT